MNFSYIYVCTNVIYIVCGLQRDWVRMHIHYHAFTVRQMRIYWIPSGGVIRAFEGGKYYQM